MLSANEACGITSEEGSVHAHAPVCKMLRRALRVAMCSSTHVWCARRERGHFKCFRGRSSSNFQEAAAPTTIRYVLVWRELLYPARTGQFIQDAISQLTVTGHI